MKKANSPIKIKGVAPQIAKVINLVSLPTLTELIQMTIMTMSHKTKTEDHKVVLMIKILTRNHFLLGSRRRVSFLTIIIIIRLETILAKKTNSKFKKKVQIIPNQINKIRIFQVHIPIHRQVIIKGFKPISFKKLKTMNKMEMIKTVMEVKVLLDLVICRCKVISLKKTKTNN